MTNSDAAAADDDQLVEVIVDASGAVIVPDSAEVVDELYERVKDRGYVTTGEIFAALPKLEPETQELADIYAGFNARGVQVIDEIEEELRAEDANLHRGDRDEPAPAPRARSSTASTSAARPGSATEPVRHTRAPRPERSEGGSFDPVRMYLKEIGKVPLLTGPQEVTLAKRIEAGVFAAERLEADTGLSDEQREGELAVVADGELAKRQLTEANLRLVVSIAKRYVGRGMALLDLVQEGNLGLRVKRQMLQELGREPTVEEVAAKVELTPDRVRDIERISLEPVSLETPVGEEDDSSLGDFVEDPSAIAPATAAERARLVADIEEALTELNEREREVVRLRFGLDDGQVRTLEEVGKQFGVTRERIRQIESKTLAKLRHPTRSQRLRDYLDQG